MVTITEVKTIHKGKEVIEGVCKSSDTKPMNYGNGSMLMEMDTSTLYLFDESSNEWRAW